MSQAQPLTWSEIDTVLLDMDGTLLDLHYDSHFWLQHLPVRYAQIHQLDIDFSRQFLDRQLRLNRGTINWYCVDFWSAKLNVDIAALRAEVASKVAFRPFAQEFLQALQSSAKKVVLVTNDHRSGLQMKLARLGFGKYLVRLSSAAKRSLSCSKWAVKIIIRVVLSFKRIFFANSRPFNFGMLISKSKILG